MSQLVHPQSEVIILNPTLIDDYHGRLLKDYNTVNATTHSIHKRDCYNIKIRQQQITPKMYILYNML